MNNVVLVGRLTRDPELRMTQSQNAVCIFTLAVDRKYKDTSGERQADFINCVAWRKTAEIINQYVKKGHRLGVIGNIQTRNYDDKDGRKVYVTEVVVDEIEFLQPKDSWDDIAKADINVPFDI